MAAQLKEAPVAHVRFEGRSLDVPLHVLGIGPDAGDQEVKSAVARHLETPEVRLHHYVIDRHETGNLTVRPQAVFG